MDSIEPLIVSDKKRTHINFSLLKFLSKNFKISLQEFKILRNSSSNLVHYQQLLRDLLKELLLFVDLNSVIVLWISLITVSH